MNNLTFQIYGLKKIHLMQDGTQNLMFLQTMCLMLEEVVTT
jgi:hypothetical protein